MNYKYLLRSVSLATLISTNLSATDPSQLFNNLRPAAVKAVSYNSVDDINKAAITVAQNNAQNISQITMFNSQMAPTLAIFGGSDDILTTAQKSQARFGNGSATLTSSFDALDALIGPGGIGQLKSQLVMLDDGKTLTFIVINQTLNKIITGNINGNGVGSIRNLQKQQTIYSGASQLDLNATSTTIKSKVGGTSDVITTLNLNNAKIGSADVDSGIAGISLLVFGTNGQTSQTILAGLKSALQTLINDPSSNGKGLISAINDYVSLHNGLTATSLQILKSDLNNPKDIGAALHEITLAAGPGNLPDSAKIIKSILMAAASTSTNSQTYVQILQNLQTRATGDGTDLPSTFTGFETTIGGTGVTIKKKLSNFNVKFTGDATGNGKSFDDNITAFLATLDGGPSQSINSDMTQLQTLVGDPKIISAFTNYLAQLGITDLSTGTAYFKKLAGNNASSATVKQFFISFLKALGGDDATDFVSTLQANNALLAGQNPTNASQKTLLINLIKLLVGNAANSDATTIVKNQINQITSSDDATITDLGTGITYVATQVGGTKPYIKQNLTGVQQNLGSMADLTTTTQLINKNHAGANSVNALTNIANSQKTVTGDPAGNGKDLQTNLNNAQLILSKDGSIAIAPGISTLAQGINKQNPNDAVKNLNSLLSQLNTDDLTSGLAALIQAITGSPVSSTDPKTVITQFLQILGSTDFNSGLQTVNQGVGGTAGNIVLNLAAAQQALSGNPKESINTSTNTIAAGVGGTGGNVEQNLAAAQQVLSGNPKESINTSANTIAMGVGGTGGNVEQNLAAAQQVLSGNPKESINTSANTIAMGVGGTGGNVEQNLAAAQQVLSGNPKESINTSANTIATGVGGTAGNIELNLTNLTKLFNYADLTSGAAALVKALTGSLITTSDIKTLLNQYLLILGSTDFNSGLQAANKGIGGTNPGLTDNVAGAQRILSGGITTAVTDSAYTLNSGIGGTKNNASDKLYDVQNRYSGNNTTPLDTSSMQLVTYLGSSNSVNIVGQYGSTLSQLGTANFFNAPGQFLSILVGSTSTPSSSSQQQTAYAALQNAQQLATGGNTAALNPFLTGLAGQIGGSQSVQGAITATNAIMVPVSTSITTLNSLNANASTIRNMVGTNTQDIQTQLIAMGNDLRGPITEVNTSYNNLNATVHSNKTALNASTGQSTDTTSTISALQTALGNSSVPGTSTTSQSSVVTLSVTALSSTVSLSALTTQCTIPNNGDIIKSEEASRQRVITFIRSRGFGVPATTPMDVLTTFLVNNPLIL